MSDKKNHNPQPKFRKASSQEIIEIAETVGGGVKIIPTVTAAESRGGTVPPRPGTTTESTLSSPTNDRDLSEISTDIADEPQIPTPPMSVIAESKISTHGKGLPKKSENVKESSEEIPISLASPVTAESRTPVPVSKNFLEQQTATLKSFQQRRKASSKVSTKQPNPPIINILSTPLRKEADGDESLSPSPQVDKSKLKNQGELQKKRKNLNKKKYRHNKQGRRNNDNKLKLNQLVRKKAPAAPSPKITDIKPKTVRSEKKSQLSTTASTQDYSVLTKQSTTRLVSSPSPAIVQPKPEPTAKFAALVEPLADKKMDLIPPAVAKEKKQPAEKKVEINPIFYKVHYDVVLSCLNHFKTYRCKALDPSFFQAYYQTKVALAINQLRFHRQIALALNDSACNEYVKEIEFVQIMLAGILAEHRIWAETQEFCKNAILRLRSEIVGQFSRTDLDAMIEQIRANILDQMERMEILPEASSKEMQAVFAAYQFELDSNRNNAKAWLGEIILELTQAYEERPLTNMANQRALYLSKEGLIELVKDVVKELDATIQSYKLHPKSIDENTQALANIAYQLTIVLAELREHYRNLESRKELASNFFNESHADVKAKRVLHKYSDVQNCESSCIAVYKQHREKLDPSSLTQFGLKLLVAEVKPLLLLHEKQDVNSPLWLSQEVQKTTLQALNDSSIAPNASKSQDEIKKAISKLEKISAGMKKHLNEAEVNRSIQPSLKRLEKLSELYELSEKLKHNHQIVQTTTTRLQKLQSQTLTQKDQQEITKLKQKLQTIRQLLSDETEPQLDKINQYIQQIAADKSETKSLRDLEDTLAYFWAKAVVIVKTQAQVINELLQQSVPPNASSDKKKPLSDVGSTGQELTPVKVERDTSELLGKTPPVKLFYETVTETIAEQQMEINPLLLEPNVSPINPLDAPKQRDERENKLRSLESTSTVSELKSKDTPVLDTAKHSPKLSAESSRFIGKAPSTQGKGLKASETAKHDLVTHSPSPTRRNGN